MHGNGRTGRWIACAPVEPVLNYARLKPSAGAQPAEGWFCNDKRPVTTVYIEVAHLPSTTLLTDPYAITTVRWLIGLVFLLSSITKLRDPKGFTMAVYNFRVLPVPLADLYAALIPYVEMITGALLLLGLLTQIAAAVAFLTLLSFTLAIGWNLTRGQHPDCHCFGNLFSEELSSMLVIRNVALMALVSLAVFTPSVFLALDATLGLTPATAALPLLDAIPCLLLAVTGVAIVLLAGQVSATISRSPWVESPWPSFTPNPSLRRRSSRRR